MNAWSKRPVVYRIYSREDELLYIGSTIDLDKRIPVHAGTQWWWGAFHRIAIQVFPTITAARAVEAQAIGSEDPRYNVLLRKPQDQWIETNYVDILICLKYGRNGDSPTTKRRIEKLTADLRKLQAAR